MPAESRADARRNYALLLDEARSAFAEYGTEASLRDVARRAGVGIGTLYRHFPNRDALLAALLSSNFDELREQAEALLAADGAREALLTWLTRLAIGSTAYRGLPESVMAALHDEGSQLHTSCVAMHEAGGRLLSRAQEAGEVRDDVTAGELLALAAGVAWAGERSGGSPDLIGRLLSYTMEGLTAG
ncbi:TetR/AcrR family transcriptional regulator [Actinoplanes sp. NPDC051513]|uniref:TetR/AcrR family transcriptional regulator n=1 Tax=Actinoplanes sp. NPDC051513 TaxID=3363908 RepID=UPI0037B34A36